MIKANSVVLFQGDSITDAGRTQGENAGMGGGYPYIISEELKKTHPELNITVINRGISGNRARDLVARWDEDCIDIKPDYLSILIGVNDTWRRYDSNDPTTDEDFEKNLRAVIERTREQTDAKLLLFAPYLLDVNEDVTKMREDLAGKQAAVRRLAEEYGTEFVDLDAVFAEKVKSGVNPEDISADGVHPTHEGHKIIAREWFKIW